MADDADVEAERDLPPWMQPQMSWYESRIDRAIREAQERGDFDNLPGAGKPLPDTGDVYDDEWWLKKLAKREDLSLALPPALALRKEIERLPALLATKKTEAAVRATVEDLNDRIRLARRGAFDGPPVTVGLVDVEAALAGWRESR
jgi:hypothetical protein